MVNPLHLTNYESTKLQKSNFENIKQRAMIEINPQVYIIVEFTVKALAYSLVPTLVTLFLTEKIKAKIKGSVDEKIENIKKEHSLEISKFQTDLNFLKTRENFKFTKLHE